LLKRNVFFNETHSEMFVGATYDYRLDVERVLRDEPLLPVLEENGEDGDDDDEEDDEPQSQSEEEDQAQDHGGLFEC